MNTDQAIHMWEGYEDAIRSGIKKQTVRVNDPFHPGPATIVIEKPGGEDILIPAEVTSVTPVRRSELTEEHAQRDGFTSLAALHQALARHYPGLPDDAITDVVTFDLIDAAG